MQKINKRLLNDILFEINQNSNITQKELARKFFYSERTIRRYIKLLKDMRKIKLDRNGKIRSWKLE